MKKQKNRKFFGLCLLTAALFFATAPEAFAAAPSPMTVTCNETTRTVTVDRQNAEEAFQNLMPGDPGRQMNVILRNTGKSTLNVYFQLRPQGDSAQAKDLLDALELKIVFQGGSVQKILYQGKASANSGTADLAAGKILLGSIHGMSESGKLSLVVSAPQTMENRFQGLDARLDWTLQFEGTAAAESIGEVSAPAAGPASGGSAGVGGTDLTRPPKTGEDPQFLWVILIVALVSIAVVIVVRERLRSMRK